MSLNVLSLFAGIAGIDLAAERAGMRTVLVCEKDEHCRRLLAHRFPDAVIHPDVTELTADDLHAAGADPRRTVLTAGWPCQGNSVAGRRGGMGDARSGLWVHVARLLAEFRPAWFVGENVPGLLSVNDGRDFAAVLGDLAELGYGWAYRVLDARYFGVPQRRARVVIVGRAGDSGGAPATVLFEPESSSGDPAASGEAWPCVAPTLEAGANRTGGTRPPGTTVDTAEALIVEQHTHTHTHRGRAHDTTGRLAGRSRRSGSGSSRRWEVAALTANGVGTCGADDNQAQAGHLIVGYDAQNDLLTGDVACTLTRPSGGANRIPHVVGVLGEQSHTLTAAGADSSEDGTGRGTPVSAFAWQAGGKVTSSGSFQSDDTTPTLPRSQTLAVAYPLAVRGRDGGADLEAGEPGDPMFALRAGDGGSSRSQLVAVHENQRGELTTHDSTALNTGGGKPGQGYPAVTDGVIVRRLTPLECERLQGLPDGWTAIEGASDSQRYRQLGNSVAVPVFEWVLTRLAAVDAESEAVA